jgi:hypothetical protein
VALLASDIIGSARDGLLDNGVSPVTWTDATMLRWLADVMAAAVTLKRDIAPAIVAVPLATGSVQLLQSPNVQFMAGYYNTSSGVSVTPAGLVLMSRRFPSWRAAAMTVDVTDVMPDERSPLVFHVNPPNNGTGNLTCLCGTLPVITNDSSPIVIPDHYRAALVDGLMSKGYFANTRRNDIAKGQAHWQMFESVIIGAKTAQRETQATLQDQTEAGA